ncbi:MAG: hypothetical protein ACP5J6_09335 [Candidatus Saccharicenans sp.]
MKRLTKLCSAKFGLGLGLFLLITSSQAFSAAFSAREAVTDKSWCHRHQPPHITLLTARYQTKPGQNQ